MKYLNISMGRYLKVLVNVVLGLSWTRESKIREQQQHVRHSDDAI